MLNYQLLLRRTLLIVVLFLIAYLSHQPSLKPPMEWFEHQDKIFHLLEYGGLGFALVLNKDLFGKKNPTKLMVIYGLLWAISDEIHQYFIPGRFCSWQDLIADSVGLCFSVWLFSKIFRKIETKKRNK